MNDTLEQMRAQMDGLKKALDAEKLTNETIMRKVMSQKTSTINLIEIFSGIALAFMLLVFVYKSPNNPFSTTTNIYICLFATAVLVYLAIHRYKVRNYRIDSDLKEYSTRLVAARKRNTIATYSAIVALVPALVLVYTDLLKQMSQPSVRFILFHALYWVFVIALSLWLLKKYNEGLSDNSL